jgi:hypothetical protein
MAKGSRGGKLAGASAGGGSVTYTTSDKTVREVQAHTLQGGYGTGRDTIAKVLEVTAKGNGEISLKENYGTVVGGSRKYPVTEYNIKGANIITDKDYKAIPESEGINWDNVKVISGSTYGIGPLVKPKGFAWNSAKSVWEKK